MTIAAALGRIDREVWIITAASGGRRGGLTATWVSSASIDPARPVLLVGLAPNHFTAQLARESGEFCAHLLEAGQSELAYRFAATSGPEPDKLAGLALANDPGPPRLAGCAASLQCRIFKQYDAGDRWFFWADCLAGEDTSRPVLREKAFFAGLSAEQRQRLLHSRDFELPLHRPLHEAWRQEK